MTQPDGERLHRGRPRIADLASRGPDDAVRSAAVDLWTACGLTRPWNPPLRDLDEAAAGPTSTVLVAFDDAGAPDLDAADATSSDAATSAAGSVIVVGSILAGYDGHRGWLYYLAVAPERQGTGLARELVRAAEAWLAARGARKVQLMVRAGNPAASLYPHLGYELQDTAVYGRWL